MNGCIYLDNNATTRLAPEALAAMRPFLEDAYANPSSMHGAGMRIKEAVGRARAVIAVCLGIKPAELIFTSGATESNYLAIRGALMLQPGKRHLVTSAIEHPSILLLCRQLEREGVSVTYLPVGPRGAVDPADAEAALRPDTALVSVMWANNETGVCQPIDALATRARRHGVLFHSDATQVVGKLPVQLHSMPLDLLSFSGHKLHGPKGIGGLYIRRELRWPALLPGHQERGRRGGTENVPAIMGLAAACALAGRSADHHARTMAELRDRLETGILDRIPGVFVNGAGTARVANTTNICFDGVDGEALLDRLDRAGILASAGAACAAGGTEPSHVLLAMGRTREQASASIRFSLSRHTRPEEIERALATLAPLAQALRRGAA